MAGGYLTQKNLPAKSQKKEVRYVVQTVSFGGTLLQGCKGGGR